jgi:hypothetical protein
MVLLLLVVVVVMLVVLIITGVETGQIVTNEQSRQFFLKFSNLKFLSKKDHVKSSD